MKRRAKSDMILAIDQGTTATKAVLVDDQMGIVAEASTEFPQHFPRPGWVEHEPDEIYSSVATSVRSVLRRTNTASSRIAAIAITNQRETTLLWEAAGGKPLHRAIVWQDRRTAPECESMREAGHDASIRRKTGLLLDPYFSATKLRWLLDHARGARGAARAGKLRFGTVDTYLTWRLSGGEAHVTDLSNASRTLLLDLQRRRWSGQLCELFGVPESVLPEIRSNDEVFAHTKGVGFLPDGIPIASILGDQQAALFGQSCFRAGEAKCTYGTGAFLVLNTGSRVVRSRHGLLSTVAWQRSGEPCYALEGSSFIAGAIVQWLRDGLGLIRNSSEVEELARSVDDSDGVVLVPALAGLGAPHWDAGARGLLCGLTRGTTAGHVARAALEGIAFQIFELVRAMEKDLGKRLRGLKVDGGATENDLLMQFQANLLRKAVIRPSITSTTALGTALMAGLAIGVFPSLDAIRKAWREDRRFTPRESPRAVARRIELWEESVRRARSGV